MTSYFDELTSQVSAAWERHRGEADAEAVFLLDVNQIEARAIRAAEAVARLPEFPNDLKTKIARVIAESKTPDALGYRLSVKASELVSDLHSIFHEVARRRIETMYGVLSDNPEGTLTRLTAEAKDVLLEHVGGCVLCRRSDGICTAGDALERRFNELYLLTIEVVVTAAKGRDR